MDALVTTLRQHGLVDEGSRSPSVESAPLDWQRPGTHGTHGTVASLNRSLHNNRSLLQQKRDAVKRSEMLAQELSQCRLDFAELGDHYSELQAHEDETLRKLQQTEGQVRKDEELIHELRSALLEQTEDMKHVSGVLEATQDLQRGLALENADLQMQVRENQWRSESAVKENGRLGQGVLEMQQLQRDAVEENLSLCNKLAETQRAHQEALVFASELREEQDDTRESSLCWEREAKELRKKLNDALRTKQVALEENKSLRARLRDTETTASQLATVQEGLQRAKSEKQALRDQITHHVETARESAQRLREAETSSERFDLENRQLKRTLAELRRALDEAQSDTLHADLAASHRAHDALVEEMGEVRTGLTAALAECQQLRAKVAEKERLIRELLEQREAKAEELRDLQDRSRQLNFEVMNARQENRRLRSQAEEEAQLFQDRKKQKTLQILSSFTSPAGNLHSWLIVKMIFEAWRGMSKEGGIHINRSEDTAIGAPKGASGVLDGPLLFGALNADRVRREELLTGLSSVLAGVRPQLEDLPGAAENLDRTVYNGLQFLGCCEFHDRGAPVPFRYELCRLLGRCSCPGPSVLRPYRQIAACAA